ncbi:MAG: hypothetical protein NTY69_00825, partial [Methylococcales bacterium]|nr:hypothetical protein [Methylococcales bacterium]
MKHPQFLLITTAVALLAAPVMVPQNISWLSNISGIAIAASNNVDLDSDNDKIQNSVDIDDDNDGIKDSLDNDDDNDGIKDSIDTDDDNDGIADK